jgi:hypothetical protein
MYLTPANQLIRYSGRCYEKWELGEPSLQAATEQSVRLMFFFPIINYVRLYF